jgi:NADH:ubiquinone reductase (H+-translocating)
VSAGRARTEQAPTPVEEATTGSPGVRRADGGDDAIPHVIVIGGGFGGLAIVRQLARARRRGRIAVRITLIDRRNHHTFQPLLYQVATAGLQTQDVGISLRAILRRQDVEIRLGDVTGIDTTGRVVRLADGAELAYDHLVIAAGAITEDFGVPGVAEHAYGLKSLAEATMLRNEVLRRFETVVADPAEDDGTLTFVVAGGGPTGVELAGALAELVDLVVRRDHPSLDVDRVRIILVEARDQLLGGFSARSGRAALDGLQERGVDVRFEVGIANVAADRVVLTDGETIPTRLVVWAAGVGASPLAATLGVPLARGRRIPVDGHLRVRGVERVFAIGDIAASEDSEARLLPQVAPVAIQQAGHVARVLIDEARGRTTAPFRYRDKGSMATIGRASAVTELPGGLRLRGTVAWLAWLLLHLLMLAGFRNRVSVLISWIWNYVKHDHSARLILDQREAAAAETAQGPVARSWAA